MVLAHKVGQSRNFAAVALLGLVTLGIYWLVWMHRAHNEVYRQFEQSRDDRDEGVTWFMGGLVLRPMLWVYLVRFAENLQAASRVVATPPASPALVLGLRIPGGVLAFAGLGMLVFGLIAGTVEAGEPNPFASGDADIFQEQTARDANKLYVPLGAGCLVVGLVMILVAYERLQSSMNLIWAAYDERIRRLGAAAFRGPVARPVAGAAAPLSASAAQRSFRPTSDRMPGQPTLDLAPPPPPAEAVEATAPRTFTASAPPPSAPVGSAPGQVRAAAPKPASQPPAPGAAGARPAGNAATAAKPGVPAANRPPSSAAKPPAKPAGKVGPGQGSSP